MPAAVWARRLLWLHAGLTALATLLTLMRGVAAPEGGLSLLVGLGQVLAFVGAVIATLVWIHRANEKAHALGAQDMMVRPGWAVAWFFVPLANLVMPFITMRELWQASANPKDWQLERTPLALPLWWACWLGSGVAGAIAFRLTLEGEPAAASGTQLLYLVSDALAVPAALLLAWLIGGIDALQRRAAPAAAFV